MKTTKIKFIALIASLSILCTLFSACSAPEIEENDKTETIEDPAVSDNGKNSEWTVIKKDPASALNTEKAEDTEPEEETEPEETEPEETEPEETEPEETEPEEIPEPGELDPAEPTYIKGILIANKSYALPSTYNPGVDSTAYSALQEMFTAAKNDGISLYVISDFRTYEYQQGLYQRYVNRSGKAEADRYSARAGHSEHQTGLAFDLNSLEQSFGKTAEGKWLKEHCHEYGFIIRYPEDKEAVTGYMYEPWHVRYLGKDISADVYESGLCLEEYLGITSVYSY